MAKSDEVRPRGVKIGERRQYFRLRGNAIEVFGRPIHLPASRIARVALGIAFILGGLLSFLPVLGVWMLPVGLLILSIDFVIVRRWRRRVSVRWGRRQQKQELAAMAKAQEAQNRPEPKPEVRMRTPAK